MKLARKIASLPESATMAVSEKARRLAQAGEDVISLSAGEPDFDTPEHIKEAAVEALRKGATKYTSPGGIPQLRAAICDKLRRENGLEYGVQQVVVSCGAKHSIYNVLQVLLEEGDEAIIPAPYWTSYPDMVALTGARPVVVPAGSESGFRITARQLDAAVTPRTRLFIFNSPSNPTGAVYPPEEVAALAEVCARRGVPVLSDEIYEAFTYDGAVHASIVAAHPRIRKELGIVVNGVSKAFAMTGWRIGYAAGPQEVMAACEKLQGQSTTNPTSIAQHAAVAALQGDRSVVRAMVAEYRKRRELVLGRLNRIPGIRCAKPDGAFYLFPDVREHYGRRGGTATIRGSGGWASELLEHSKVAVVPGAGFGYDPCVRISYASSMQTLDQAMDRIESFVSSLG